MAIKGLTDGAPEFPSLGVLHKGAKKTTNAPGRDLTYFRFDPADDDARRHFEAAYPTEEHLRRINILLPFATPEENFINRTWIERWVAGGLDYRSDGENIIQWRKPDGSYSFEPKPDTPIETNWDGKREDDSRWVGRLVAIVPELGRLATVTIQTTSKNDIAKLSSQLKSYYAIEKDLRGIPFVIVRREEAISTPMADGKRGRRKSWLLSIETQPDYTRRHLAAVQLKALPDVDIEAEFEEIEPPVKLLPDDIAPIIEDAQEVDDEVTPQSFATVDDLLYQLNQDFGLGESQAKDLLKELGFNGFKKSASAGMYEAVRVALQDVEDVEVIETDPINSDNPVLSEIFTDAPQIPGTEKLTGSGAAYTE